LIAEARLKGEPTDQASSSLTASGLPAATIKQCCAALYGSDVAKLLLGDSFHPGGISLTERLGELLSLTPRSRVLDVAAGRGASAIALAKRFGCAMVGVDLSAANVEEANRAARDLGMATRVSFQVGDAEALPFPDGAFDAVICECAFCTFPNKQLAANAFVRVLAAGGQAGISDLIRTGPLPPELDGLFAWTACVADARSLSDYVALLSAANLSVRKVEEHNDALTELVSKVRTRLLAVEAMAGLRKIAVPGFDLSGAKSIARHALRAIAEGRLGYAIVTAIKP
jgi:arsenite methyltransferase